MKGYSGEFTAAQLRKAVADLTATEMELLLIDITRFVCGDEWEKKAAEECDQQTLNAHIKFSALLGVPAKQRAITKHITPSNIPKDN